MDETRRALYRWMTGVMLDTGWTANAWAMRAEVTPTNLTRFLKDPAAGSLPSAETIGRLARAARSEPRFLSDGAPSPSVFRVPLLSPEQARAVRTLSRAMAEDFLARQLGGNGSWLPMAHAVSPRAFAIEINSPSLNAAGVLPCDRVVVEPSDVVLPRQGDVVVALDGAMVHGLRYYPPHLLPVSTDPSCLSMACDGAVLAGVAVQVVRSLRP